MLKEFPDITVRVVGRNIIVDGVVVLPEHLITVDKMVARYPEVVNLVGLDSSTMETIAAAITREIARPGVTARVAGSVILLEGSVYSQAEKERAEMIANALLPRIKSEIQTR